MEVSIHMAQCVRYTLEMQKHVARICAFIESINPEWVFITFLAKEDSLVLLMRNWVLDDAIQISIPYDYLDDQDGKSWEDYIINNYQEEF